MNGKLRIITNPEWRQERFMKVRFHDLLAPFDQEKLKYCNLTFEGEKEFSNGKVKFLIPFYFFEDVFEGLLTGNISYVKDNYNKQVYYFSKKFQFIINQSEN